MPEEARTRNISFLLAAAYLRLLTPRPGATAKPPDTSRDSPTVPDLEESAPRPLFRVDVSPPRERELVCGRTNQRPRRRHQ